MRVMGEQYDKTQASYNRIATDYANKYERIAQLEKNRETLLEKMEEVQREIEFVTVTTKQNEVQSN